jgi:hypothetical protein
MLLSHSLLQARQIESLSTMFRCCMLSMRSLGKPGSSRALTVIQPSIANARRAHFGTTCSSSVGPPVDPQNKQDFMPASLAPSAAVHQWTFVTCTPDGQRFSRGAASWWAWSVAACLDGG